jgi:ribonucleoside-diphosphate reductase alpha chain
MLHWTAWKRGVKSLYYCRSKSLQRAAFAGRVEAAAPGAAPAPPTDYEECLACQ